MTTNANKIVYTVLQRKNKLYARESNIKMGTFNLRWVFKRRYKNKPGKSKMNAWYNSMTGLLLFLFHYTTVYTAYKTVY